MGRYGDDQCAQCGGIRVRKSTLCVDCLAAVCVENKVMISRKVREIEELKGNLRKATEMYEQLLEQVLDEAMYTHELHMELWAMKEQELIGG